MISTTDLVARLAGLMADLLAKTNASRTALRQELDRMSASKPHSGCGGKAESLLSDAPLDSARLLASKKVPEPDSLGG